MDNCKTAKKQLKVLDFPGTIERVGKNIDFSYFYILYILIIECLFNYAYNSRVLPHTQDNTGQFEVFE